MTTQTTTKPKSTRKQLDEALEEIAELQDKAHEALRQRDKLTDLVLTLHCDDHEGVLRFCSEELCRVADEVVNGSRLMGSESLL